MSELNKKNPFKTPEEYFEGFNYRLMERLSEEASGITKEDGFVVPERYFDTLHGSILKKMDAQESKVIPLKPYKKYYYAAASIAAIVLVFLGLNWKTTEQTSFDSLVSSDIDAYFENNDFGLSSYEIGEVIPLGTIEISDILENQLNEEPLLDYLDENIEDFESLNLEDNE